jgi:hypothetical protein
VSVETIITVGISNKPMILLDEPFICSLMVATAALRERHTQEVLALSDVASMKLS